MDTEKHTELPCMSSKLLKRLKQKEHRLKACLDHKMSSSLTSAMY